MIEIFKDISWRAHSVSLFFLLGGLVLFVISGILYLDKKSELQQVKSEYQQQRYANQNAGIALQVLDENSAAYNEFRKQGVVGEAQRLQWIETTQKLSEVLGIPLVEFTLNSAEALTELNNIYWNPEFDMQITPMSLEMDLRHEGEFLKMMSALQSQAEGIFSIDQCDLRRNPASEGEDLALVGLKGKCAITWFSIKDVTSEWELSAR